jgi:hypothetical protein
MNRFSIGWSLYFISSYIARSCLYCHCLIFHFWPFPVGYSLLTPRINPMTLVANILGDRWSQLLVPVLHRGWQILWACVIQGLVFVSCLWAQWCGRDSISLAAFWIVSRKSSHVTRSKREAMNSYDLIWPGFAHDDFVSLHLTER